MGVSNASGPLSRCVRWRTQTPSHGSSGALTMSPCHRVTVSSCRRATRDLSHTQVPSRARGSSVLSLTPFSPWLTRLCLARQRNPFRTLELQLCIIVIHRLTWRQVASAEHSLAHGGICGPGTKMRSAITIQPCHRMTPTLFRCFGEPASATPNAAGGACACLMMTLCQWIAQIRSNQVEVWRVR